VGRGEERIPKKDNSIWKKKAMRFSSSGSKLRNYRSKEKIARDDRMKKKDEKHESCKNDGSRPSEGHGSPQRTIPKVGGGGRGGGAAAG